MNVWKSVENLIKYVFGIGKDEYIMTCQIIITVKNQEGMALAGANVSYNVNGIAVAKKSDENGIVAVAGLPADQYKFTASIAGYQAVTQTVNLGDGAAATLTITLPVSSVESAPIQAAEQEIGIAISKAIENSGTGETTPVQDWKNVKANAEAAIQAMSMALTSTINTDALYVLIAKTKQDAYDKVEAYKSQLMISRHTKNFWQCVGIDIELAAIITFEYWAAGEINKFTAQLKEKLISR